MLKLKSYRTVYGLVSRYIKNEKLRQVLSFHTLLVGGNPFSTTSIYALISALEREWGVHFPMGGTGVLVDGLVNLIEGQGGSLRFNTEVKQLVLDGRKARGVRLASGEVIEADLCTDELAAAIEQLGQVAARLRLLVVRQTLEKRLNLFGVHQAAARQGLNELVQNDCHDIPPNLTGPSIVGGGTAESQSEARVTTRDSPATTPAGR